VGLPADVFQDARQPVVLFALLIGSGYGTQTTAAGGPATL
jgi:hypothetical protein